MPSLNVLFWNVQKKDLTPQIVNLAKSQDVDILVLAENPVGSGQLVQALNTDGAAYSENHPLSICQKITIVTKFHHNLIAPITESERLTIRKVKIPMCAEFLLAALHLPDKGNFSTDSQAAEAAETVKALVLTEQEHKQDAMVVVGDFNMNPFEVGMISTMGFHGTMSSELAIEGSRTVQGRTYPYFYNPTWGLFGDLNKEASGTYFYRRAEHVCYQWNIFDQVLLRASLIPNFVKKSLCIIQHDGVTSLLADKKRPNKNAYSDHLPLFFTLTF